MVTPLIFQRSSFIFQCSPQNFRTSERGFFSELSTFIFHRSPSLCVSLRLCVRKPSTNEVCAIFCEFCEFCVPIIFINRLYRWNRFLRNWRNVHLAGTDVRSSLISRTFNWDILIDWGRTRRTSVPVKWNCFICLITLIICFHVSRVSRVFRWHTEITENTELRFALQSLHPDVHAN